MALRQMKRGSTGQIVTIWIGDSSSTTGAGLTGLVYNSAGLVCKYQENDQASATTVTLATMTQGTWASGGFVESSLGKGWYQFGVPDAAITSGKDVAFVLYGATNMVETPILIELTAYDMQNGEFTIADGSISSVKLGSDCAWLSQAAYGTAQAGGATTITLAAGASSTDDYHKGALIYLRSGTGLNQTRLCVAYNGTTKVATVARAWATNPDATTVYNIVNLSDGLDTIAEIGTGSALTALATQASVDDLPTNSEMQAMIDALNQSASRRAMVATSAQWEVPESGSNTFTIQLRCYDADGVPTNADSDPSITITGIITGDLSANLSAISNPATGVYKWTYTNASGSTTEQVELTTTPTIGGTAFPVSTFPIICDFVAATFTTADRTKIEAVYNKLPSKNYLAGSSNSDGDIQLDEATGALPWNAAWDAEVQSEVDDGLKALYLQYLFEAAYNPASKPGHADGLLNKLVENDAGVPRYTANALEQSPASSGLTLSASRKAALESILDLSITPIAAVVVDDAGNTATTFKTNMTTANGFADMSGRMVAFGPDCATTANRNQVRTIVSGGHNLTTGVILVHEAFGAEPADADVLIVPGASREE